MSNSVFLIAEKCLLSSDVDEKLELTVFSAQQWEEGLLSFLPVERQPVMLEAGRPQRPKHVESFQLPKRTKASDQYHPAFVHALAHIEFNAINLAWDAVYRFRDMPKDFYTDWIRVAREEAYHFQLLRDYIRSLGHDYGDYDAHGGLWAMAMQTTQDVMVRMALVPRVLEARGLDVTPGMIEKLAHNGKDELVEILKIIYHDEIGHVEIGTRWFNYVCNQRDLDSDKVFTDLIEKFAKERIKKPINDEARIQAGFNRQELDYLYSCL